MAREKRRTAKVKKPLLAAEPSPEDAVLYPFGLVFLALLLGLFFLLRFRPDLEMKLRWPWPCPFLALTGKPCPGCGGTRALRAFCQGQIAESFRQNAAVPCTVLLGTAYLLSQTLGRLSRGRLKMLTFRDIYLYVMLGVILLQWAAKLV